MIALFILCIAMFCYLCYVLIKPENFNRFTDDRLGILIVLN